eukprot:12906433-Prorocentrum_lima.AAC.1
MGCSSVAKVACAKALSTTDMAAHLPQLRHCGLHAKLSSQPQLQLQAGERGPGRVPPFLIRLVL